MCINCGVGCSVSLLLTTTEAVVAEIPEAKSGRPSPRAQMPTMDNMGYWCDPLFQSAICIFISIVKGYGNWQPYHSKKNKQTVIWNLHVGVTWNCSSESWYPFLFYEGHESLECFCMALLIKEVRMSREIMWSNIFFNEYCDVIYTWHHWRKEIKSYSLHA